MVLINYFHSCFGENGVQILDSSTNTISNRHTPQNLVECVYRYQSQSTSGFIIVTWIRYLMGQGLSIGIQASNKESLCKVDIKTWLFSKRKGTRNVLMDPQTRAEIHWDLSSAKFGSSPEPLEGFYIAVSIDQQPCLLIGDSHKLRKEHSSPKSIFLIKKEHIFGKRLYFSKAQFCDKGRLHVIRIEHDGHERNGHYLAIFIDDKMVLQVPRLKWKFRGNQNIFVDGVSVEVYWDVHNWLFGNSMDHAVFLFRTHLYGENSWNRLQGSKDFCSQGHGFSLILCAWKNE